jgi:endonuclease-3 related protein
MSFTPNGQKLRQIFDLLLTTYGRQKWWPGDSSFEVMVGAILTQNTAWSSVEMAITNLKDAGLLHQQGVQNLPTEELAQLIRPSGYYNQKAKRLHNLCRFLEENGGEDGMSSMGTAALRNMLLSINGIGPETADDILLYALHRPVFVVDAYTRRIFSRLGMLQGEEGYEEIRRGFEHAIGPDTEMFNEYHALIVLHGKETCKTDPHCDQCSLSGICVSGNNFPEETVRVVS